MKAADSAMTSIRSARHPLVLAMALLAIPIIAICLVQPPQYSMLNDDSMQVMFANGSFLDAGSGVLMPYTLAPVSAPLALLYQLVSGIPWYALLLLVLIDVSFAVALSHAWGSPMSNAMCACFSFALVACEIVSVIYITYTLVAFLAVNAGLLILLRRCAFVDPQPAGLPDVGGAALVFFGFSLRPESGMAAFVIFAPFALWVLISHRRAGAIVRGAVAVGCVAVAMLVGQLAYDMTPGWEHFDAYLDAGRNTLDYPSMPTEEWQSCAPELSDADVDMLTGWLFADADVFPVSLFEQIGSERPHFEPRYLSDSLHAKTTYVMLGLVLLLAGVAWALARDIRATRGARVLAAGIICMLLASCLLLVVRARPRMHVLLPLVMTTLMALVAFAYAPALRADHCSSSRSVSAPILVCLFCVVLCGASWVARMRPAQAGMRSQTVSNAHAFIESHPHDVCAVAAVQNVVYARFDIFSLERWDFPSNMITVGGWERETPNWETFLDRWGLSSGHMFNDLVDRDAYVIMQDSALKTFRAYLEQHGPSKVAIETVQDLGPGLNDASRRVLAVRLTSESE